LTWVDHLGVWLSRRPILNVVQQYERPVILDLGCGYEAKLLRDLSGRIERGVGVDLQISPEAKSQPGLSFVEGPIEQALPGLAAASFDVVLLVSVLEHLWNPQETLTACRGLLKPGGSLVVNVPDWLGKTFLEFSAFRLGMSPAKEMDDHKMYYGKRDLWPVLVRAGFKPSRITMRYHKLGLNLFAVARAGAGNER
jgi:SAM-dependent methyltransferase